VNGPPKGEKRLHEGPRYLSHRGETDQLAMSASL
jgi:hypothetical protein